MSEQPKTSDKKRILITGANRGIGLAVARALVEDGHKVMVHARDEARAVRAAMDTGAIAAVAGDLADPKLGERMASAVKKQFGQLDVLHLNAAILGATGPLHTISPEALQEAMALNVTAQLRLFSALEPLMTRPNGAVIWMSSGLGRFALPGYGAYAISKHALEGMAKLCHADYSPTGLISVSLAPGMVQTEMLKQATGSEDVSAYTPPEVAGQAFANLVRQLKPEMSGTQLDLPDFAKV